MAQELTFFARVMCIDGVAGELISLVIHPETGDITHLVIKDKTFSKTPEWRVPMEKVIASTSRVIQLDCTREDSSMMQPFIQAHYLEREFSGYGYAFNLPVMIAPEGVKFESSEESESTSSELTLHRSMDIEAIDGFIGQVGELLLDPQSKEISHFVLKRGHYWGKKDVIIPLSLISQVDTDTIHLKVEKKTVEAFATHSFKRPWKEVYPSDLDLLIWIFSTKDLAESALNTLNAHQEINRIHSFNVAIINKNTDGISLREISEVNTHTDTFNDMIKGGLADFLFSPDCIYSRPNQGTGDRAKSDQGVGVKISNGMFKNFREYLPYGSSAIALIIEHRWFSMVSQALARYDHVFFHQRLTEFVP